MANREPAAPVSVQQRGEDRNELDKRLNRVVRAGHDLLDEVDGLLRVALGLDDADSDGLFADRARMMVANFRQKTGE